jgi:hypothetical protein
MMYKIPSWVWAWSSHLQPFKRCYIHKMNLPYKRFNPCTWSLSCDGRPKLDYVGDFQFLSNQLASMSIFMLQVLWVFEGYTCLHQWSNPSRWQSKCSMYFEKLITSCWWHVEILVKGWYINKLIHVALTLGDVKEHFASLAFRLELYVALLQCGFKEETKRMFLNKLQD